MGIREIRRQSNRVLHDKMKVPALYYLLGQPPINPPAPTIYIRAHFNVVDAGEQAGTSLGAAVLREDTPKVIFDLLEVPIPKRLDVVILSATEGYRVDHMDPAHGEFQNAAATRLSADELATFDAP